MLKFTSLILFLYILSISSASIAYFESYGWPSYGIVKPFWMTPFSDHPSYPISDYSRKHYVHSAGVIAGPRW